MTGAELLALARHNRGAGAGEGDGHIVVALVNALSLLWEQVSPEQRYLASGVLQRMLTQDMIRRQVRNDYSNAQARTNS